MFMSSFSSLVLTASKIRYASEFSTLATIDVSGLFFVPESDCSIVVPVKLASRLLMIIFSVIQIF